MPTTPYFPLTVLPDYLGLEDSENAPSPEMACSLALDQLRGAFADYQEMPVEANRWWQLLAVRRNASAVIARLPRKLNQEPVIHEVHELVREMAKSGVHDHRVEKEDLALADAYGRKGWPGLLAAMLLVPAGQWPGAPLLMEVPGWLRADFVRWLFAAPKNFTAVGEVEAYRAFVEKRLEEILRWLNRGPGRTEVLKVLGAYASHSSLLPLCSGTHDLRHHAELRGQLLRRIMGLRGDSYQVALRPRADRRLRIGIIHRHFEGTSEIHALLPLFEQLDLERFEVVLFTYVSDFSVMEEYCRQRCTDLILLPPELNEQLSLLRSAALDVVLFGTNVIAECNVVTRLALHRVAQLQVVNGTTSVTSGLPEIDLYVTGARGTTEGMAGQFSERLAVIPGATHCYNLEADRGEMQVVCTRADFGVPEDALVFVSTAGFQKITPEVQHAWARILAVVPGSWLLLHPFHGTSLDGHAITHFHAGFEAVLRDEGVDPARLVASTVNFPSRMDVQGLVRLGDVYLDPMPFSGVDGLVDALSLGLPVVVGEGAVLRARTGASLLREMELGELIAGSAEEYGALAVKLGSDAAYRESCRERMRARMEQVPTFLDARVASHAFGDLMERAFDELVAKGRAQFRMPQMPVI